MTWPFWLSGGAIGLFVVAFAWLTGKAVGVSAGYGSLCGLSSRLEFFRKKPYSESWRLWFILGIPLGGLAGAALSRRLGLNTVMGTFDTSVGFSPWLKVPVLLVGGALIGFGARWAGGCTSGHAIVGVAQGAKSSVVATMGFMVAGVFVANLFFWILGALA